MKKETKNILITLLKNVASAVIAAIATVLGMSSCM